jgi:hypothetical protein
MLFSFVATALLAQVTIAKPNGWGNQPRPWGYFTNNTIYQTTGNESITYPRYTELLDGTIIATASLSGHDPNYFPVFESKDGGAHWKYISNLTDQVGVEYSFRIPQLDLTTSGQWRRFQCAASFDSAHGTSCGLPCWNHLRRWQLVEQQLHTYRLVRQHGQGEDLEICQSYR